MYLLMGWTSLDQRVPWGWTLAPHCHAYLNSFQQLLQLSRFSNSLPQQPQLLFISLFFSPSLRMQTRSAAATCRVSKAELTGRGVTTRRHLSGPKLVHRVVAGQAVHSRSSSDDISDAETAIVASTLKYSVRDAPPQKAPTGGLELFLYKLELAWSIFFPIKEDSSPKDEVKSRLRMVLVADRCGMSPASLSDMKASIMKALEAYIDIDCEESIDVAISSDPLNGTVYSVNIPVKRVKADIRFPEFAEMLEKSHEGVTVEWSPDDWESDPSKRFPMGC